MPVQSMRRQEDKERMADDDGAVPMAEKGNILIYVMPGGHSLSGTLAAAGSHTAAGAARAWGGSVSSRPIRETCRSYDPAEPKLTFITLSW